jgi:hypothetical protein
MGKRFLEDCLAKGMSLEAIGRLVGKHPLTVAYSLRKFGLPANGADKFAPRGGIDEEVLMIMSEDQLTLREMAEQLDRSKSTVRHWLKEYGLELARGRGRPRRAADGSKFADFECRHHGRTEFVLEGSGYYRCKKCRSEAVMRRRRKVKEMLVHEAGGACVVCGYDRNPAGLEFHHLDPAEKSFGMSIRGLTRGIETLRSEAAKCALLCATCHAEVEVGALELPLKLEPAASDPMQAKSVGTLS